MSGIADHAAGASHSSRETAANGAQTFNFLEQSGGTIDKFPSAYSDSRIAILRNHFVKVAATIRESATRHKSQKGTPILESL